MDGSNSHFFHPKVHNDHDDHLFLDRDNENINEEQGWSVCWCSPPIDISICNVRQHVCVWGGALQIDVHIHRILHVFDEYSWNMYSIFLK